MSPPKMFRGAKGGSNKSFSMEIGLANIALTASSTAGITGAEEMVHRSLCDCQEERENPSESMMSYISQNVIGKDLVYHGPFGPRRVIYCDYTASGKSLRFIEDYIRDEVLPYYGNTHTTTTVSSLHTGNLRTEAKQIIRKCINATDEDAVIFVSSGTTGAINKLIHGLNLKESPIVFISPYEHHSNLLPWLEIGAEIIYGSEDENGCIDLKQLELKLQNYSTHGRPMIGSFSAASNITGILSPVDAIAVLLHRYGAFAFFDYATAGPYVEMDMNPAVKDISKNDLSYKDAIFCSIHKFVGGPGTPGLLVAKKNVFINPVPSGVGGGTVLFVTHNKHEYVDNVEEREEGGTPAIVESIRAGLVFQIKQDITSHNIMIREHRYVQRAFTRWKNIPNLYVLGQSTAQRLPIFPLFITHPTSSKVLHHNFVSVLLNDLFGIQARGGCACAGPYAEDLLSIESDTAMKIADILKGNYEAWRGEVPDEEIEKAKGEKYAIFKPGFCRLNLPYFESDETIDYILDSVAFIAEHGWKLLPAYNMLPEGGDYVHKEPLRDEKRSALSDMSGISVHRKRSTIRRKLSNNRSTKTAPSYRTSLKAAHQLVKQFETQIVSLNSGRNNGRLSPWRRDISECSSDEVEAMIKDQIPDSSYYYTPLFHPRANPSVHIDLNRTRRRTGIDVDTFCNCEKQTRRHLKLSSCSPGHESYQSRDSFISNDGNSDIPSITIGQSNDANRNTLMPNRVYSHEKSNGNTLKPHNVQNGVVPKNKNVPENKNNAQNGVVPKNNNIVPENNNIVQNGIVPKNNNIVSKNDNIVPNNTKIVQNGIVPKNNNIVPKNNNIVPENENIVPNNTKIIQNGSVPKNNKTVPKDTNIRSSKRKSKTKSNWTFVIETSEA